MDTHGELFIEEATELLAELETSLLELEKSPQDPDLIGRIFRAMHTIKGSGAMFGFEEVAGFTHDIESAYDLVRNGKIQVTKTLIDLTLKACDEIRGMIDPEREKGDKKAGAGRDILSAFRGLIEGKETPASTAPCEQEKACSEPIGKSVTATYRIQFRPKPEIFGSGMNPLLLLDELRGLGQCTVIAHTDSLPTLEEMDPALCYTYWDIILTTDVGENAIRDVFIFVEDMCDLTIRVIENAETEEGEYKKVGEILVERGDLTGEEVRAVLGRQRRIGEMLVDAGVVAPARVESALAEQEHIKAQRKAKQSKDAAATIRVPADRLDQLVNLVGELVTIRSRLTQTALTLQDSSLVQIAEEVERLISELRDKTMSIRMLPIGSTFSRFKRLVRDLTEELGKEIILTTEGEDTELDKTVIEKLADPLTHLIRNSIDHGIESPEVRTARGKTRQGKIHMSAFHSGACVVIQIEDDGAGIDKEAVRMKAVEKGIIPQDAVLQDRELFSLIFAPGFSTAKTVSSVSGRGVGMDVVKRNVEALQGTIEIESREGEGTLISLKLPLTLAIIDGLLVKVHESFYVVPLASVEECVELSPEDIKKAHGRNLIPIRGEIVPYVSLREKFKIEGERPPIEQIVTSKINGDRVGLLVDQVIGQHQTVIKSLGKAYRGIKEVSGATILGDGTLALILEMAHLVQEGNREN
ncbi:MAG: chemotaxis protein CheA [Desulfobacteraceae bacterium]|nr:MAG: chemotaxis protein CheA [Desulfobacteraceae bacterium]